MELLCIESHPEGIVIAGQSYPFLSDKGPCKCNIVNVGIIDNSSIFCICRQCGSSFINDGYYWVSKSRFAQIAAEDEVKEAEQVKELIEQ